MFTFKRPEYLKFPTTYYTFKAKDKNTDKIVDYRVQDLPEEFYEEALNLLVNHFLPDEELNICRRLSDAGIEEHRELWAEMIKPCLSIACFNNNDDLVGVNVQVVNSKNDSKKKFEFEDQGLSDIMAVLDFISSQVDIYEKFNVESYLGSFGLVINPDYRGRGIATEILKAREFMCKELGLELISNSFSATASQNAAIKAGYKEVFSITYDELRQVNERFKFLTLTKTEFFKIMALKIS